jgi:hypothetical protein
VLEHAFGSQYEGLSNICAHTPLSALGSSH